MKQFWTPLALGLGLVELDSMGATSGSNWETHAWLALSLRQHGCCHLQGAFDDEVEHHLGQRMCIKGVHITALSEFMSNQLQQLQAELDSVEFNGWIQRALMEGFSSDIHWEDTCVVHVEGLNLQFCSVERISPYAFESTGPAKAMDELAVVFETSWIEHAVVTPPKPWSRNTLEIWDAQGSRDLKLSDSVNCWVFGASPNPKDSPALAMDPAQETRVTFEDGMAQFIALHGRHVSRRHLVIRWTGEHFEFQDLKSTNGTFGLLDKVAFESDTWHRLQPGDRIFLGGQASDERRLSPAVCLSPPQRDHQATPMRISLDAADKTWDLVSPAHGLTWRVCQLPFLIGRDPACDAVVPTQHRMVSRKHLVIVSIDLEGQSWEVKDLSTQKLTHFLGPVQSLPGGIYRLQLDSQVILGQTASASGLNLCLLRNGGKV